MNGPTMRRFAKGSTRPTSKGPMLRRRFSIPSSIMSRELRLPRVSLTATLYLAARIQIQSLHIRRNSVNGLDRQVEPVANAALRLDIARPRPVDFDLAPQTCDLHVDGAIEDLVVVQPRKVQQLVPSENALGRGEQDHEEIECRIAERDLAAVGRGETTRAQVELPAVEAVGAHALGPPLPQLEPAAAQDGPDAGEQLARAAGLGEVIVGGGLESDHAVDLVLAVREDDDRQGRLPA